MLRQRVVLFVCAAILAVNTAHPDADVGSATGVWTGDLTIGGVTRKYTFQLHERVNQRLLGYMLGGTSYRTILDGVRDRATVGMTIELQAPDHTMAATLSGSITRDNLRGTILDGTTVSPFRLRRLPGPFSERRFIFAAIGTGGLEHATEVAVALKPDGRFLSGGFVAMSTCGLWGCGGGLTAFNEVGDILKVRFENGDPCSVGSHAKVTFDASTRTYTGTYVLNRCGGEISTGSLIAARTSRTDSAHAASVLAALGRVADDFETAHAFASPHASFSPAYLDFGDSLTDVFGDFNAELAQYSAIQADFPRISVINTVADPDRFPGVFMPLGAEFEQVRSGAAMDGSRVTYVDTHSRPERPRFRIWTEEGGNWVIRGNQAPGLKLPFRDYTLHESDVPGTPASVVIEDAGTPLVFARPGPFGAHFQPLTGHAYGNSKGDWAGFFTRDDSDLSECAGDGDGIREPGEIWGFRGGAGGAAIRSRIPTYVAPRDGTVVSLMKRTRTDPSPYFDAVPHWNVVIELLTGERLRLDHVGRIASNLRDKVSRATSGAVDTDDPTTPEEVELLDGVTIGVLEDEELAQPQVVATETAVPGCYIGGGTYPDRPWAQMEWQMVSPSSARASDVCFYDHLDRSTRQSLQTIVEQQMNDQLYQGYRQPQLQLDRWRWSAEARLCNAYSPLPRDFSAFYTSLGGWFETDSPGAASDEIVAFAPIAKDTAAYQPWFYASPAVSTLILRQRDSGAPYSWMMPDGRRHTVFYPAGEIVEQTADTMLIRWRDAGIGANAVYQRAAYILDAAGLKIRWSPIFALTPAGATVGPLTAETACDGEVACYDHQIRGHY